MNSQRRIGTTAASTASAEEGSMEITKAAAAAGGGEEEGAEAQGKAAVVTGQGIHKLILDDALARNCALVNDNSNIHAQREGMDWFKKTLSTERSSRPPVDAVVACGIVPRMISFLALGYDSQVQTRACAAISHLACADGDYVGTYLVEHGVIAPLVTLLRSAKAASKERLREICLSCVGNLSAYTKECRDLLLNSGIMEPLLGQLGMQVQMAEGTDPSTSRVEVVKHGVSPSLATMT
jgi:hypothetical protein